MIDGLAALNSSAFQNRSPLDALCWASVWSGFPDTGGSLQGCSWWGDNVLSDKRYFARRAFEESSRAARSLSPTARSWHQELADKFSKLARENCEASADDRVPA
jgi:hypothetical protein